MLKRAQKPGFNISKREIKDLTRAWIMISIAFAIAIKGLTFTTDFLVSILIFAISVGTAFVFHEMAHKIIAQQYGCFAEFRSFNTMLWVAIFMSFFGFIFAAPGAVMISGPVGVNRNGKIAMAGPTVNIVFAIIFLYIATLQIPVLVSIASYGYLVNSWIALFNLIPFAMFDGKKILAWNKTVYGIMVIAALILMMLQELLVSNLV